MCDDTTLAWCTVGVTAGEVDARIISLKGSPTGSAIQLVPKDSRVSTWRSFVTYNLQVTTAGKYILGFVGSSYNGGSDSVYLTIVSAAVQPEGLPGSGTDELNPQKARCGRRAGKRQGSRRLLHERHRPKRLELGQNRIS